jgi:hypothetical protein
VKVGRITDVWRLYRVDGAVIAPLAGQSGREHEIFSSEKCPDWLFGPPSFLFSGFRGSFLTVKRPGPNADHSSPSSAVYKNKWPLLSLFTFLEFTGNKCFTWLTISYILLAVSGAQWVSSFTYESPPLPKPPPTHRPCPLYHLIWCWASSAAAWSANTVPAWSSNQTWCYTVHSEDIYLGVSLLSAINSARVHPQVTCKWPGVIAIKPRYFARWPRYYVLLPVV